MASRMRSGLGRRIPSSFDTPETVWSWPRSIGSGKRDRASSILAVATVAVIAVVAVAYGLADRGSRPVEKEPIWMIEPPPPSEPVREEIVPQPETVQARPSIPRSVAEPSPLPVSEDAPDPVFGIDDPVPTGGIGVPVGNSLAMAPEPAQIESVPPLAGPRMLDAVPGSVAPVVPKYPPRAEVQGIEGRVVALVTTDSAGNVVSVKIERSAGRDFDESVRRAVLATTFRVPTVNGRARPVAFRMPYNFRLE